DMAVHATAGHTPERSPGRTHCQKTWTYICWPGAAVASSARGQHRGAPGSGRAAAPPAPEA
ncbi:MAG: hypothetical protein V6Z89_19480, partial [Desulfobacter sp.]